jgi:hypothetical protein
VHKRNKVSKNLASKKPSTMFKTLAKTWQEIKKPRNRNSGGAVDLATVGYLFFQKDII